MSDIRLYVTRRKTIQYPDDVRKIIEELNNRGIDAFEQDVQDAYRQYSDEHWACGWLMLGVSPIEVVVDTLLVGKYLVPFDEPIEQNVNEATF